MAALMVVHSVPHLAEWWAVLMVAMWVVWMVASMAVNLETRLVVHSAASMEEL